MGPRKRRATSTGRRWAIGVIAAAVAGCCGGAPNHKCDFTPPPTDAGDGGGSDGPLMCGTEVCVPPQVCCVTKAPLAASCIDAAKFESLGCEKMPLPCVKPGDCPMGLACCVVLTPDLSGGTVSCQPQLQCLTGPTSFVACTMDVDCPSSRPMCDSLGDTPQGDFKICK